MHRLFYTVTLVCVLLTSRSSSQTYYDAKLMRQKFDNVAHKFVLDSTTVPILKKYFLADTLRCSDVAENPFLKDMCSGGVSANNNIGLLPKALSLLTHIGGLNVTKYANAIADIMIERAKQELTIAFFNRFQKFADDHPEFKILFPKTNDNLSNLLSYTYPQMLPTLRDGFFEDLKQITYNLEALLDLPRYRTLLDNFPEIRVAIRSLKLIHGLEHGELSADKLIVQFAAFPEWTEDNSKESVAFKNTAATVQFAALLSESLRNE